MRKYFSLFGRIVLLLCLTTLLASCEKQEGGKTQLQAAIGKPAPDFTLSDLNGKTWKLSDLKGKVVFVNFWATWCPPCRQEMPSMQALYKEMASERFEMLAILQNDDPARAEKLARQLGITFPILVDPESKAAKAYGLTGVPETFIVDASGILREKFIGAYPWDSPQAKSMIGKYIP